MATVTTSPNLPKINGHNLSEFFADTEFTHRTPSAMANFGLDSIRFNASSATITVNDVERDSNNSDKSCDSDNDGSGHTCGNYYQSSDFQESQGEESQEYQGAQYLSTDTAERRKIEWGLTSVVKDATSIRPHSDSSDSAAESHSSKKSRKRQSRNQRNQNQANQKIVTEMQDQFNIQSELMSQNNKNIGKNTEVISELQDKFNIISEKISQNNENIEKNTTVTAKSHQTILKSYSHFSEKSENFNILFQSKKIIDLECQIKDLKELIELGP